VAGDPLAAMAVAGRATTGIELGTAVVQTYPCHPVLQAGRAVSVPYAMGRPGFTLGIGPSHRSYVEGALGLSYAGVGAATDAAGLLLPPFGLASALFLSDSA
jgi:alkanesulfonate monooxygenase SsuD/methylene tetrahydromethanopterin reductase-like flavin-dependent oxidoreductase (luciferase family)